MQRPFKIEKRQYITVATGQEQPFPVIAALWRLRYAKLDYTKLCSLRIVREN